MQGYERADRQLLDAEMLAGHLIPAGSMFAFLAGHRAGVFPDAEYADLFAPPGVGRPSLPATQMAAIMTLQTLCDYSDRETAEAVRFDVRWKVACGFKAAVLRQRPRARSRHWPPRAWSWPAGSRGTASGPRNGAACWPPSTAGRARACSRCRAAW